MAKFIWLVLRCLRLQWSFFQRINRCITHFIHENAITGELVSAVQHSIQRAKWNYVSCTLNNKTCVGIYHTTIWRVLFQTINWTHSEYCKFLIKYLADHIDFEMNVSSKPLFSVTCQITSLMDQSQIPFFKGLRLVSLN